MLQKMGPNVKGVLDLFHVSPDGRWKFQARHENDVMYSGYDVQAKLLGGAQNWFVNGMYLEFLNGAVSSVPSVAKSRNPDYYEALSSPSGYCRVATVAAPKYSASDSNYAHNKVTFTGVTDGSSESGGAALTDGVSNIHGAALVVVPDWDDKNRDVLFSAANLLSGATPAPVQKIANANVGIKWTLKYED